MDRLDLDTILAAFQIFFTEIAGVGPSNTLVTPYPKWWRAFTNTQDKNANARQNGLKQSHVGGTRRTLTCTIPTSPGNVDQPHVLLDHLYHKLALVQFA